MASRCSSPVARRSESGGRGSLTRRRRRRRRRALPTTGTSRRRAAAALCSTLLASALSSSSGGGAEAFQSPYCRRRVQSVPATTFLSATVERKGDLSASAERSAPPMPPLFDPEEVGDDGSLFRVADVSGSAAQSQSGALFEDVEEDGDWYYDDDDDDDLSDDNIVGGAGGAQALASDGDAWTSYERDEDDMLTEREDRLYVDEKGLTRKVERCVLVGVEDLGAKRRKAKQERRGVATAAAAFDDGRGGTGTRVVNPEEDQVYFTLEESMTEMKELIKSAGLELAGEVTQRLNEPNPKTYIGSGKVSEAQDMLTETGCCTVVFDAELTPGQQKALENAFNKKVIQNDFMGAEQEGEIKVIDRTALILDIFAQHAKTREGKLQVDLALHEYRKPRLTRMWTHLERQSGAGGVGLRGPGESQLEIDKRLLRDRIIVLRRQIDDVQKQRDLHRRGRRSNSGGLPVLALVGYTNAGKSTLLNHLTKAGVIAEDMLFATVDPTTRRVKLPGHRAGNAHPEVLLTDTVGFIQKLPTQLVAAFRATLEEVREADVLVHVVDVSNPMWRKQESAVLKVLDEIGAGDKPVVRVLNKIDALDRDDAEFAKMEMKAECRRDHAVALSSLTGEGMKDFVEVTERALAGLLVPVELLVPYSKGEEMNTIHEVGSVDEVDYREDGTYVKGRVPRAVAMRLEEYSVVRSSPAVEEEHPLAKKMRKINGGVERREEEEVDWMAIGRGRHSATGKNF